MEESSLLGPRSQLSIYIKENIPALNHIPDMHSDLIDFAKNQINPLLLPVQKAGEKFSIKNQRKKLKRDLIYHWGLNLNTKEKDGGYG